MSATRGGPPRPSARPCGYCWGPYPPNPAEVSVAHPGSGRVHFLCRSHEWIEPGVRLTVEEGAALEAAMAVMES